TSQHEKQEIQLFGVGVDLTVGVDHVDGAEPPLFGFDGLFQDVKVGVGTASKLLEPFFQIGRNGDALQDRQGGTAWCAVNNAVLRIDDEEEQVGTQTEQALVTADFSG